MEEVNDDAIGFRLSEMTMEDMEEVLNKWFPFSKNAILQEKLFPLNIGLLSSGGPNLCRTEYTSDQLVIHYAQEDVSKYLNIFNEEIPGWVKVNRKLDTVLIDKSKGRQWNKDLEERVNHEEKKKMMGIFNYLIESPRKEMHRSEMLHQLVFKSGLYDQFISNAKTELEVLLFVAPQWISMNINGEMIYRINGPKTQEVKMDLKGICEDNDPLTLTVNSEEEFQGSKTLHRLLQLRKFLVRRDKNCSICFDPLFTIANGSARMLNCSHTFHSKCIQEWFSRNIIVKQTQVNKNLRYARVELNQAILRRDNLRRSNHHTYHLRRGNHHTYHKAQDEIKKCQVEVTALENMIVRPSCPLCNGSVVFPFP